MKSRRDALAINVGHVWKRKQKDRGRYHSTMKSWIFASLKLICTLAAGVGRTNQLLRFELRYNY